MSWNVRRFRTGSKDLFADVRNHRPDLFPHQYMLFQIAVAIGIHEDVRKPITGSREELIDQRTTEAFDKYGVFKNMLQTRHPDKSEQDLLVVLEEFAEHGIHIIHDQVTKTGTFNLTPYIEG